MNFCRNHIVIYYRKGHNEIYMLLTEDLHYISHLTMEPSWIMIGSFCFKGNLKIAVFRTEVKRDVLWHLNTERLRLL